MKYDMENKIDIGGSWDVREFLYEDKALLWRDFTRILRRETGLMEFVCKHGVGHPAKDSARVIAKRYGHEDWVWQSHGCCGCCGVEDFPDVCFDLETYTLTAWRKKI